MSRTQRPYNGAYSPDFKESNLMESELNWMPGPTPNVYVRDAQNRWPGKKNNLKDTFGGGNGRDSVRNVNDDTGGDFSNQLPGRDTNHPKY